MSGASDGGWQPPVQGWAPLADLSETDEAYQAEAGLPGVRKDDISVEMAGQELVISGELQRPRPARPGAAPRAPLGPVRVPGCCCPWHAEADKVTAALADGVLTVTVPKAQTDKPRRIQITAG